MQAPLPTGSTSVIHAAGGLVWRQGRDGPELILIQRRRYGEEWSLPKGKADPGESWEQTALREVREETGYEASLGGFAGGHIYLIAGCPKVVLYWHMQTVRQVSQPAPDEITALRWETPAAAVALLTHPSERDLLMRALPDRPNLAYRLSCDLSLACSRPRPGG